MKKTGEKWCKEKKLIMINDKGWRDKNLSFYDDELTEPEFHDLMKNSQAVLDKV